MERAEGSARKADGSGDFLGRGEAARQRLVHLVVLRRLRARGAHGLHQARHWAYLSFTRR